MTRYAVGDLQGCLEPLKCLMNNVEFNSTIDQLWLVGDLINRGPDSLGTLRYVKGLGNCTRIVLGNHDLHFLAIHFGAITPSKSDTFTEILAAPDREEIVQWLLQQPLFYSDPIEDYHMVHAGIPPSWTIAETAQYAREVEKILKSNRPELFFNEMYGNKPNQWHNELTGLTRLRVITNFLTRMRYCTANGELNFDNKLNTFQGSNPEGFAPWFAHPQRAAKNDNIIFGHWAALEGKTDTDNVFGLDTGCVWGRNMTLMNLETKELHTCKC